MHFFVEFNIKKSEVVRTIALYLTLTCISYRKIQKKEREKHDRKPKQGQHQRP